MILKLEKAFFTSSPYRNFHFHQIQSGHHNTSIFDSFGSRGHSLFHTIDPNFPTDRYRSIYATNSAISIYIYSKFVHNDYVKSKFLSKTQQTFKTANSKINNLTPIRTKSRIIIMTIMKFHFFA
jgi:hypothetical protein